jgi:hypothetical protein
MTHDPDDEAPAEEHAEAPGEGSADGRTDNRVRAAWRSWLSALATDAEAAMAAALAYESLPHDARDAWLDALEADAPAVGVPAVALYAPLLAVESEPGPRRTRIEAVMAAESPMLVACAREPIALRGVGFDGTHACVIIAPLYLQFVQVLSCRYTPGGGFVTVQHDPMRHADDVAPILDFDGVPIEATPLRLVVEELAHAILADKREQRATPQALASFAHLFAPDLDERRDAEQEAR